MMDLEKEINSMVRKAIMEEINNLAIRATMREKIEAAGVSHEDIRNMISETVDSYMRSAMNGNVEEKIKQIFEAEISKSVQTEIKRVIGPFCRWDGESKIIKALDTELNYEIKRGFNLAVSITPKENTDE